MSDTAFKREDEQGDSEPVPIPELDVETLLNIPRVDAKANGPDTPGALVYVTGDGADAEGLYQHQGGSYTQVGGGSSPWDDSDDDGILSLPNDTGISIESLVIGGTLYEEDDNSPIDVTNVSSTTFTLANSADDIIIIPEAGVGVHEDLQVNGDTGSNYDNTDSSDSETTGESQFVIKRLRNRAFVQISDTRLGSVGFRAPPVASGPATNIRGENSNISAPITQFTISDSSFTSDIRARVYRRAMSV
jgi:hypothetical protein